MATQETIKQLFSGGVLRDIEDADARQAITALQNALNALTSGDTTTAIENFQEVIDFLDGVTDDETLIGKITALQTAINGKQPMLTFDNAPTAGSNNPVKSGGVKTALDAKVNTETGKGLSSNDYTTAEKTKLANLPTNPVRSISVNGEPQQMGQNGNVDIDAVTQQQMEAAIQETAIEAVVGNGDFAMTYDESTDTYNIVRLVPTITVSDDSLAFDSTSKVKTITISGHNLKADIGITAPTGWTASVNSLAQVDGVVAETQVTLTYGGADASTATGNLELTAGTAIVTVPLSYTQYGGPTITVSDDSLEFEAIGGQTDTDTVTVGLFNITGNVSVNVGGGVSSKFSASLSGNTLTITYTPGSVNSGTHTDTITLSAVESGETISKAIAVTGTVLEQSLTITSNPSPLSLQSDNNVAATGTINVKGQNITGNVTLSVNGSGFTLSENSLAAADVNSANGVDVTVTATIASGDTASATISASSGLASASISAEWNKTEVEDVGVVVTRPHGYASADAASPTIGIKFRITELPSGGGHGKAMVVNSLGKCGYYTELGTAAQCLNYNGMYRAHVPATISINGNIYDVTELGGGCFCYCASINYISFEEPSSLKLFQDNKDSDAIGANMTAFSNSVNFKGTSTVDSAHIMKFPYGVTSVKTNAGGQTMVSHIYAPDTLTGFYPLAAMPNVTFIDLGSGVTDLGIYAIRYTAVRTLILRSATKVAMYNNTVVNNWPNGVTVYVPSALISAYESDANWTAGGDKITFAALEGSEYETSIYNN